MNEEKSGYSYGKRPLWQLILLYVVIAGVLYGLVYYFVFAGHGYSNAPTQSGTTPATQQSPTY